MLSEVLLPNSEPVIVRQGYLKKKSPKALGKGSKLAWPALIRKLERMGSDYAT